MGTNAIEMITHGRIHYRSDTPTCEGVNFHFDNRTVMSEILQFNFILYEIQPVDLTWRLEEDIIQHGAKILGSAKNGTGVDGTGRIVWEKPELGCQFQFITNMEFKSASFATRTSNTRA